MIISLKTRLFSAFVKKAMKKYIGKEDEYIRKRLAGQDYEGGKKRESNYFAPNGFTYASMYKDGIYFEMLSKLQYEPLKLREKKIIYMLHGGAYHAAMSDLYSGLMEKYSDGKYEVFAVDYRTAPKDIYPCAVEDAVKGYELLISMGYRPENIIVAGDSAGGGLALSMAMKLNDMGIKIPTKYILSSPWVDLSLKYTSDEKEKDILFGWGNVLETCAKTYIGSAISIDPYVSPFYGDVSIFKNCDFYISVADGEMLMKQGICMAHKLKDAGARVDLDTLNSGVHDVITMYALNSRECRYAWERIHRFLGRVTRF